MHGIMETASPTLFNTIARLWMRWRDLARRKKLFKKAALWLAILSTVTGLITFAIITLSVPVLGGDATVQALMSLCLLFLATLAIMVSYRLVRILSTRRQGKAGSALHLRLVSVFSLIAVTPTLIVAIFAGLFFYLGVQGWFSERVQKVVDESMVVANSYLSEHQQAIRADALAMANDINREAPRLITSQNLFNRYIDAQTNVRSLASALVIDGSTGKILGRSALSFSLEFDPITEDIIERARKGDVVVMVGKKSDNVRALVKIDALFDAYLLVGRAVEGKVLEHVKTAEGAVAEYAAIKKRSGELQGQLFLTFIVVALLLLLVAIWFGMNFANRLGTPLSVLVDTAERVRGGDLTVRIQEKFLKYEDELGSLGRAFNRMTDKIDSQTRELVDANKQLDMRRRFTEAVLSGVSAGVIGVDHDGKITLMNTAACYFLQVENDDQWVGKPLLALVPEMSELMVQLRQSPTSRAIESEIEVSRNDEPKRTFFVRLASEQVGQDTQSYVMTFDDVSDLIAAQRKAAWGDVARRIAHEIKNPLTPIQLSAERLRRRYLKEITSDPAVFTACLDTIIRQVDDIGRMVDEFSAFARMPKAVMVMQNINDICRQAVLLQSTSQNEVDITANMPPETVLAVCDGRLVHQSVTNLIKNAMEAIEGREAPAEGATLPRGHVEVSLEREDEFVRISVADNGRGLPKEERHRLTEPYVTTRAKGTGLGLAIVRKIMEEHHGALLLEDRIEGGARVILRFPVRSGEVATTAVDQAPRDVQNKT